MFSFSVLALRAHDINEGNKQGCNSPVYKMEPRRPVQKAESFFNSQMQKGIKVQVINFENVSEYILSFFLMNLQNMYHYTFIQSLYSFN